MTKITYGIVETHEPADGNTYPSYGIAAYAQAELNASATVIASINNITTDRKRLMELVQLCNLQKLSLIHLNDVVEDFLID